MTSTSTSETSVPAPVCIFSRSKGKWFRTDTAHAPHTSADSASVAAELVSNTVNVSEFCLENSSIDAVSTAGSDLVSDMVHESSPASPAATDDSEPEVYGEFRIGDAVCVFRRSTGSWLRDGIVAKVLSVSAVVDDGLLMPAGAVKVVYDDCSAVKWVPPAAFADELKHADFMVGDAVSVLCRSMGLWVADGLVVEVLQESAAVDGGLPMPAGSVKVTYANGDMAKWIPPEVFSKELRAQRQWICEGLEDHSRIADAEDAGRATLETTAQKETSIAATKVSSFMRSFSRLMPIMGMVGEASARNPDVDDDEDAYFVSGAAGVASSVLGRYRRVGEHSDRPKYRNEQGAVIYFDEHWKMNVKDDMLHWCYEVRGMAPCQPPVQAWAAYHFYGDSSYPVPTVARAADVELLAVSGVNGPARAVNGRYMQAGMHNEQPKYKNSSGAIIFFDGYWKMNDRDDVLAWRFAVKDTAAGSQPPSGEWASHWSFGAGQAPAHVRLNAGAGRAAEM
mmetsp:Transcript_34961/g.88882  ORF Transcript_34961/g.88882 Transcript_34961/m.88882 type:complete len:507 (+) Transcript_34961:100-1620(+)